MNAILSLIHQRHAARQSHAEQEQRASSARVYIARDGRGRVIASR